MATGEDFLVVVVLVVIVEENQILWQYKACSVTSLVICSCT